MRHVTSPGVAPLLLLIALSCRLPAQTLVRDLNLILPTMRGAEPDSSGPDRFVRVGTSVYFLTTGAKRGLWRSDGTAAGTTLVRIVEGVPDSPLVVAGNTLYFTVAVAGDWFWDWLELYRSDGTPAGTRVVACMPVTLPHRGAILRSMTELNGRVVFVAENTPAAGTTLWTSDGTAAGTHPIVDIWPRGYALANDAPMITMGGVVYFAADDGLRGTELWRSDGTAAGTWLVRDIEPAGSSFPGWGTGPGFARTADTIYFAARTTAVGTELWRSDGTWLGTWLVRDIRTGPAGSGPGHLTVLGSTVCFAADDGVHGVEPWRTGDTPPGTHMLLDTTAGVSEVLGFTAMAGQLFFRVVVDGASARLFATDGTSAGTRMVATVPVPLAPSVPPTWLGSRLYFEGGADLWVSDGTPAGTVRIHDVFPRRQGIALFDRILFGGTGPAGGFDEIEPWRSDGTAAGTALLADLTPTLTSSFPQELTPIPTRGIAVFAAHDGTHGRELWRTTGTNAGTVLVADIHGGITGSDPAFLTDVRGDLYFAADDSVSGRELWRSDGTAAGTRRVADIVPGATGSDPAWLTQLSGVLYFVADDGPRGAELWRSDGTAGGTVLVRDIRPGAGSAFDRQRNPGFLAWGGALYFAADDGSHGVELWRSDGTLAGTSMVKDIDPGAMGSAPVSLVGVGGLVFFVATEPGSGRELWRTDGTTAGTLLVKDIRPGDSNPAYLVEAGGFLAFSADDGSSGRELWRSDGTAAGTVRVLDIHSMTLLGSEPRDLTYVGGTLFFSALHPDFGRELWKSNGTAAGTVLVQDILPGCEGSDPESITRAGSGTLVLFSARTGTSGREVHRSDGTMAGTNRVGQIAFGPADADPHAFTLLGSVMLFAANDGVLGEEPYVQPLVGLGGVLAEPFGIGSGGNGFGPRIVPIGLPLIGANTNGFGIGLQNGPPGGLSLLCLSDRQDLIPFGPSCQLYLGLPFLTALALPINANGFAQVLLRIPNDPGLLGAELFAQHVVVDPNGCVLGIASVSDALHVMLGM